MDSVHRHMAIAKEKQETVSQEECIYTIFLHCNCSSVDLSLSESPSLHMQSFFAHPPLPVYIYYWRSISNRYGSLLSAVAMGLDTTPGVTVGLPMAMRMANHCCNYLPVHCIQFAWFEGGE